MLSIIKEIEIIGEAASKLSEEYIENHSDVPWIDIVGMRNRLIHGYFDVDIELIWNTVKKDLPDLIIKLKKEI
ncbi:MAG TPA: HepT-like ribonuclease domain-containing protein [Ignavibacteriaceae bacterium]|nr:HepT-like ribonuclease domain-containing protein [Ignavibacteriaceae bacterium]